MPSNQEILFFKNNKGCFEKKSLQMGTQGFTIKETNELLLDILKKTFQSS